ncbi:Hypothetical Protein FCC1311_071502 [Hondaea fermentalgiana]|uniref:Uncharacterized protein n=1 Tax=Hondaea fermentalgiana TaxID=2315210 RepID=A0A2R5GKT9_9STRA|nr:Hypothetical Protein FCC1311_071502 [Hondaea fermentalgiana]|eukprot:GBG30929.1 Hypothetical Protein FCC1311_071502 [Hondaea fermentalgiana]
MANMKALHAALTTAALVNALWTVRVDLRYFYGWQGGAWMFKFTHWSLTATLAFLLVSFADVLTGYGLLAAPRRWCLLTSSVLAFAVDFGFFGFIFPKRLKEKDRVEPILTVTSAHKHAINLLWLLADAGSHPGPWPATPQLFAEVAVFSFVVPVLITAAFYQLAKVVKDETRGVRLLEFVGVPLPEPEEELPLDARKRGNMTAIPGQWIYGSFKHDKLRTLFLLSPVVYGPVTLGLLGVAHLALYEHPVVDIAVLALITGLTPALYLPEVWKHHHVEILDYGREIGAQINNMMIGGKNLTARLLAYFSRIDMPGRREEIAQGVIGFVEMARNLVEMVVADLTEFYEDLDVTLEVFREDLFAQVATFQEGFEVQAEALRARIKDSGMLHRKSHMRRRSSARRSRQRSVSYGEEDETS